MQLKIVANVRDQSGGIYHASYSLGLVLHVTGAPEVACGGSQHLPLAQQSTQCCATVCSRLRRECCLCSKSIIKNNL